jgi:hypothetical protein
MKNLDRFDEKKQISGPVVSKPLVGVMAAGPRETAKLSPAREVFANPRLMGMAIRLIARATMGSDIRFDKVAALQQAIAAGTYSVAAADVADRLMAEAGW